jgi:anti-anti-sigma regulatory factor
MVVTMMMAVQQEPHARLGMDQAMIDLCSGTSWIDGVPYTGRETHYHADIEWKMEPALELWIDVKTTPVRVRLAGVLDKETYPSVRSLIEELLEKGYRNFAVQIEELDLPDSAGFSSLDAIQRAVRRAGGSLSWSSWPADPAFRPHPDRGVGSSLPSVPAMGRRPLDAIDHAVIDAEPVSGRAQPRVEVAQSARPEQEPREPSFDRQTRSVSLENDLHRDRALVAQDRSSRGPVRRVASSSGRPPEPRLHRSDFPRSSVAAWEAAATHKSLGSVPAHARTPARAGADDEPTDDGVEANARLTGMTAVVLLVLLAIEGLTILRIGKLLTLHVVIGMVLVPPILLKIGSTTWRFARYYLGSPEYRRKGPPPALLRLLGPFLVALTVAVVGTGIAMLLGPASLRQQFLFLHKATFILWIAAMTVHVLGHIIDTARLAPKDFYWRTRRQIRGAGARQWALVGALCLGVLLAITVAPKVGPWRAGRVPTHVVHPPSRATAHPLRQH